MAFNIIWNQTPTDEKLRIWKKFREHIAHMPTVERLEQVAHFFAHIPIGARAVDFYDPRQWPTPWELIHSGACCPSTTSLLMYHSLTLSGTDARLKLILIDDHYDVYLIPVVDDIYVLNYELNTVSQWADVAPDVKILKTFEQTQITPIA